MECLIVGALVWYALVLLSGSEEGDRKKVAPEPEPKEEPKGRARSNHVPWTVPTRPNLPERGDPCSDDPRDWGDSWDRNWEPQTDPFAVQPDRDFYPDHPLADSWDPDMGSFADYMEAHENDHD